MPRVDVVKLIVRFAGASVQLVDLNGGWPAIVNVRTSSRTVRVALHAAAFARLSYRGRDAVERRMQNPENKAPVLRPPRSVSVILGLWEEQGVPVLVGFDAKPRIGKKTRQSFFGALAHLRIAKTLGWTSYRSGSDEEVFAFWPQMLPAYVDMVARGVRLDSDEMAGVVAASGLSPDLAPLSAEARVRRTTSVLVRRAAFSAEVVDAYGTLCAMCGLDFGLTQGAHIYPAAAPGSSDDIRNGLALCANHHTAFDRHLVHVHPRTRRIRLHPRLLRGAKESNACRAFIETTARELIDPAIRRWRPLPQMFVQRYKHFADAYDWVKRHP
jgi:hypothetical protein